MWSKLYIEPRIWLETTVVISYWRRVACSSIYMMYMFIHIYHFCVKETWKLVSMHWQQGKYQLWANCYMCWMPVANSKPHNLWQLRHPLLRRASSPLGPDPSVKNGWALTVWSDTQHNNEPTMGRKVSPLGCFTRLSIQIGLVAKEVIGR